MLEAAEIPDDTEEAVDGLTGVPSECSNNGVVVHDDEAFLMAGMPGLAGNALSRLTVDLGEPGSSSKVPSRPQD